MMDMLSFYGGGHEKLLEQIIKFGIVGVICFIIDFAITTIPTYFFGQNTVYISAVFGFVISCIVNYLLSIKYVFTEKKDMDKRKEFIVFVILSAVGLVINELIIYLCQDVLYANVAFLNELIPDSLIVPISKIIATGVVMVYNFISRKIFLEGKRQRKKMHRCKTCLRVRCERTAKTIGLYRKSKRLCRSSFAAAWTESNLLCNDLWLSDERQRFREACRNSGRCRI